jgi:hypothetical protein
MRTAHRLGHRLAFSAEEVKTLGLRVAARHDRNTGS